MIICHDSEFVDDGETIELLTIGLVAENGDELYHIVEDADWGRALDWGAEGPEDGGWISKNVIEPHLPIKRLPGDWTWASGHPDFNQDVLLPRWKVAQSVERFLWDHAESPEGPLADLWAYYPATDHVALYQLFGPMVECTHHGVAMRTSCLKQHEVMLRRERPDWNGSYRPIQDPKTEHHALHDARHDMELARWLGVDR